MRTQAALAALLCLPIAVFACSSTNTVEDASPDAPSSSNDPSAPAPEPSADDDSGTPAPPKHDAGADAKAPPVTTPGAWTAETPKQGIFKVAIASPSSISVDPVTPRRLLLRFYGIGSGSKMLAVPWTNGTFGSPLVWASGDAVFASDGNGGGFAPSGEIYDFVAFHDGRVAVQVGVFSGTTWQWKDVQPPGFGSWPPRSVVVSPGSPARAFLRTDSSLVDLTSTDFFPTTYPVNASGNIALDADRTTYLALSGSTVERCTITTGACTPIATTGFGTDVPSDLWFDPYDATRIFASATSGAPNSPHVYASTDVGASFQSIALPANTKTRRVLTVPKQADTFVVETYAVNNQASTIQISRDHGVTWTVIPPPPTSITDISGLGVDAAGTLFLVREATIFSMPL